MISAVCETSRLFAGAQADCLWTDPPYGVEYVGKTARRLTIANDERETSDGDSAGGPASAAARSLGALLPRGAGRPAVAFHRAV